MNDQQPLENIAPNRGTRAWRFAAAMLGPILALLCVIAFFAVADAVFADGTFWTFRNMRTVSVQTCVVAVAALGMTMVIVSGGIDLSAGTALALCATVLALGLREDVAFYCWQGDNFAGASRKLADAQDQLADASLKAAASPETASEKDALINIVAQRRETLLQIMVAKIETARRAEEKAASPALKKRRRAELQALEKKQVQLNDANFHLDDNRRWLSGVANAPATASLALLLGLLTGVLAGVVNGLLVSSLRVAPFIITLGAMTIYLGLGNLISGNVPVQPALDQIPHWLGDITRNSPDALWFGFPYGVWLVLVLAIGLALVLKYSVFGRHVFAIGSNEATARLCGIQISHVKIGVYGLSGLFLGVAGAYQFSRLSVGNPTSGLGLELRVIAAVVIGGASLNGGRGSVLGTLTGAAIMAVIASGCTQLGLENPIQDIILGGIIISAVTVDQIRQRRQEAS